MRRTFELNGRRVESETRQCDVNCWELRITDSEGNVSVQYFNNPGLLDAATASRHRVWKDQGWVSEPIDKSVPTSHSLTK